jgi:hypothetical protein
MSKYAHSCSGFWLQNANNILSAWCLKLSYTIDSNITGCYWIARKLYREETCVNFIMSVRATWINTNFWLFVRTFSAGKWYTYDWKTHRHCYQATPMQTMLQPRPEGATWRQLGLTSHHGVHTACKPPHCNTNQITLTKYSKVLQSMSPLFFASSFPLSPQPILLFRIPHLFPFFFQLFTCLEASRIKCFVVLRSTAV